MKQPFPFSARSLWTTATRQTAWLALAALLGLTQCVPAHQRRAIKAREKHAAASTRPAPPKPAEPVPAPRKVAPLPSAPPPPVVGAAQFGQYLSRLRGQRVALVVNQTSRVGTRHLLDTLRAQGVNVVRILAPEHGFRGAAGAGDKVNDTLDATTRIPIVSLYGATKKPLPRHLDGTDVVVFDLQDVGARFYTYIATLHYVLEACAEQHKPVVILDRPNPNGDYIDGPVLEPDCRSFVGLDPLPIVHGLTLGEAARMMVGEGWLANGVKTDITVVPVAHYTHRTPYELPVAPSPNLRTARAVRFYPSLCLFEGTGVSVGRGTDHPFEQIGHPAYPDTAYHFVPRPTATNAKPMLAGKRCYGPRLADDVPPRFTLRYLIDFYQQLPQKNFFNPFFDKLAGTKLLRQQLETGLTEAQIRLSWQSALGLYREKRAKYLLYED